jgi:hypothetical protein
MTSRRKILEPSAFEPFDPAAVEVLLERAKLRSAQLRRRRMFIRPASIAGRRRSGNSTPGLDSPRRFSLTTMAFASVGVVVAIVVTLVAVNLTSSHAPVTVPVAGQATSTTTADQVQAPEIVPAPASVVDEVTGVSAQIANDVGLPPTSSVLPPTVSSGQPPLVDGGKPTAIFIGGEFCPYCAADRWAIVMAFSRFGTFSNLSETTSSPWEVDPSTATFSFYGSSYYSPNLVLDTDEYESNDTSPGAHSVLQPLSDLESTTWKTYDKPEGLPFLDIGNSTFVMGPSFDARVLAGLDQDDIAARLTNPNDPVTQAIVGTANYLTAAICSMIGSNAIAWPTTARSDAIASAGEVCKQPAVTQAAHVMGLN